MGIKQKKKQRMKNSPWRNIIRYFLNDKLCVAAIIVLFLLVLTALTADLFFDYQTDCLGQNIQIRNQGPSLQHWLGTDNFGRDLLARIVYGSRYSLVFGIFCTALSLGIGSIFGCMTAYIGGAFDNLLMRALDALMCIPAMLLMLLMVAVIGNGMTGMVIALTISSVPGFTRIIRSVVLSIVQQDYIEAARVCGTRDMKVIFKHVLPNAMGPILVNGMMSIAGTIMAAAGLSYIGMGIQPPIPEWGNMLSDAMSSMRSYPHIVIFPGIFMILTSLCFNLVGDGMSDAIDPKRNGR